MTKWAVGRANPHGLDHISTIKDRSADTYAWVCTKNYPLQGTKTHYISFDTILNSVHFGQSFLHSNNEVDPQKMSRQITALAFQVLLGPLITQKSHFW